VCQATAEQFQVIDRQVVEAIAAAEGTTLEEATFDGRRLKWSAEARRVLRDVTDAYLRRRAKARIEKVARMQKLAVITRELAVPLIEETVGSDRLDGAGTRDRAEDEARGTAGAPVSTRPAVSSPARSAEEQPPQLNWTNAEGQLNEVAAGRVAVVPPPIHSRQE
jgi:hypothetical protein